MSKEMGFKRRSVLGIFVAVAVTLTIQYIILTVLFKSSVHIPKQESFVIHVQSSRTRSLSNVNVNDLAVREMEIDKPSERSVDLAEEKIILRKRSREKVEELERAPKQPGHQDNEQAGGTEEKQVVTEEPVYTKKASDKEITGLRQATVRNNGSARPTRSVKVLPTSVPRRRVLNRRKRPNPDPDEEDLRNNKILEDDWENQQLKLIKANKKLSSYITQTVKPMNAYWKSLKLPRLQPGESVHDYVAHIHSLGKSSNLTRYMQEVCNSSGEPFMECMDKPMRKLTPHEEQGRNIMFTIRTTKDYHDTRLGTLFETWVTTLYPESLFLVTDDEDSDLAEQLEGVGMHYINAQSGHTHCRSDLCCKAGVELELMFQPENEHFDWVCHVDDDMYVHVQPLAKQLSKFSPRTEPIYMGRSGSEWGTPRIVNETSKLGKPGQRYHFAVGGMYCLSRAMLELAKPYLVGCHAFSDSCNATGEPEDVTVGLVIGAVLKKSLTRTDLIWSHGLNLLGAVPAPYIRQQIAFSHGYGSGEAWTSLPNVVFVPGGLYSIDEDITQFKSIHCHIYPTIHWCMEQKKFLVEEKRKAKESKGKRECYCSWQDFMCCEVMKTNFFKVMSDVYKHRQAKNSEQYNSENKAHEQQSIHVHNDKVNQKPVVDPG